MERKPPIDVGVIRDAHLSNAWKIKAMGRFFVEMTISSISYYIIRQFPRRFPKTGEPKTSDNRPAIVGLNMFEILGLPLILAFVVTFKLSMHCDLHVHPISRESFHFIPAMLHSLLPITRINYYHHVTQIPTPIRPAVSVVPRDPDRDPWPTPCDPSIPCLSPALSASSFWARSNQVSKSCNAASCRKRVCSHRIHVWYIYLIISHKNQPNVGNCTIHGWYMG